MLGLIVLLTVLGVGLYLIERLLPMDPIFRTAIRLVVVVTVFWYLLDLFGVTVPPGRAALS